MVELQIILDKSSRLTGRQHTSEPISGSVHVSIADSFSVDYIEVRLEGVAKTKVKVREKHKNTTRDKVSTEEHRLLYHTTVVFPPANIRAVSSPKTQFTLTPGSRQYPFRFVIPHDNSSEIDLAKAHKTSGHKPCFLPPTLPPTVLEANRRGDLLAEAEIVYYVKVVCKRKGLFQLSATKEVTFDFLPVDIDRDTDGSCLVLAKDHIFREKAPLLVAVDEREEAYKELQAPQTFLFTTMFSSNANRELAREYSLHIKDVAVQLQVRYIDMPGARSGSADNFSVYVTTTLPPSMFKLSNGESSGLGQVFLSKMKMILTGTTWVKAGESSHQGSTTWPLACFEGLHRFDLADAVESPLEHGVYEVLVPHELYREVGSRTLYPDMVPSFDVCSIRRWYTLQVTAEFKATANETGWFFGLISWNKVTLDRRLTLWSGLGLDGLVPSEEIEIERRPFPGRLNNEGFSQEKGKVGKESQSESLIVYGELESWNSEATEGPAPPAYSTVLEPPESDPGSME
ncbi:hypothetical protein BABINDRAFT_166044 [Babjeviella inositovora NRRL Y-12698]|uniref:Arrestin-like N-terminal domain-containing protein n=1 Tax=Babjeviella inositovora NRRL Y-12698 TaxID=984486 RepID=A0A1E3QW88_9ASCO|nr:uncharacterized protein BABINDRAFT_166044 [Babjeviella inositovora NRRL Y-12698]ODQ81362.1 hypothetical protein BABINDRAFT_166044 [Babjeviella inositovora NRRL Y-12698]